MAPYFLMLALPGLPAAMGARFSLTLWRLVFLIYWLMIGFRFEVGMDWLNYLRLYDDAYKLGSGVSLATALFRVEPGFALLSWFAAKTGGGLILINAVSALVFCWGLFAFAKRCPEPFLAIAVATPLVVIAMAMNLTRQAMAFGTIAYLFATWEQRGAIARVILVLVASTFHFSVLFVLVFVALSAKTTRLIQYIATAAVVLLIVMISIFAPDAIEAYSRLYVSGKIQATGALSHVAVLATAALLYVLLRRNWIAVGGHCLLYWNLALAALAALPLIMVSSVGAYRFSLYLWPMAMFVYSGIPAIIDKEEGKLLYRLILVAASAALLLGWLTYANNSSAWQPYQNWLFLDERG
jgi:hypothetical protein